MDIDVATIGMQSRWRKVVEPLTAVHNNGGNEMYKRLAILKHVFTYWGHGNGYHWAATQHMHAHQLHRRHTHTHTCFRDVAHAPVSPTSHALISSKSHVTHTLFSQTSYIHRFHRSHTPVSPTSHMFHWCHTYQLHKRYAHQFHRRHTHLLHRCYTHLFHPSYTHLFPHTPFWQTSHTHTCFIDVTHTHSFANGNNRFKPTTVNNFWSSHSKMMGHTRY